MTFSPTRIRLLILSVLLAASTIATFCEADPPDNRIIARPRHKDRPNTTEPRLIEPIPALPPSNIPQTQPAGAPNDRKYGGGAANPSRGGKGAHSAPSRPGGYAPAQPISDVLIRRFGSEKFQQLMNSVAAGGNPGMGASNSDVRFDGSRSRTGLDAVLPAGTQFFSQPKLTSQLKHTTPSDADTTISNYGSIPGGVVLEGVATSLGRIDDFEYDGHVNAFIINSGAVYFARVPPKTIMALCHAIARDEKERIGVSLGQKQIIYGEVPPDSDLAWDLKMADDFLGDIVFAKGDKTEGYRFADGYKPQQAPEVPYNVAVFFTFNGFEFHAQDEEIQPSAAGLDIRLLPLSESQSADGGHLPDKQALTEGRMVREFELNAEHVASNISYYRGERIVERMFDYGEVAAILRQLKSNDFDLDELANRIEASIK